MTPQFHGWGRTSPSAGRLHQPRTEEEVITALARHGPCIARGLGRSYGDAAQVAGGDVLTMTCLNRLGTPTKSGELTVGAGVSLRRVLTEVAPLNWTLPVVPGTADVTVGGAFAADVHGKDHHRVGSFANHVVSFRLVSPVGARDVSPADDDPLFWSTAGAMGMTGVVTEVTLQLERRESQDVDVRTTRTTNLAETCAAMRDGDDRHRYSVAWVDGTAAARARGRAIVEWADPSIDGAPLTRGPRDPRIRVPLTTPWGAARSPVVRAANAAWYRHRGPARRDLYDYLFPLDSVGDWNRLLGPRGFLQYQFVVPDDQTDVIDEALERLRSTPPTLIVLKRFGPGNRGPLSFPRPGWTMAVDLPVGAAGLSTTLDRLDVTVARAGGSVYLAKDARLSRRHFAAMYPRAPELWELCRELDPHGVIDSDLRRRLVGPRR